MFQWVYHWAVFFWDCQSNLKVFDVLTPTHCLPVPLDRGAGAEVWRPSDRAAGGAPHPDGLPPVPAQQELSEDPQLAVREQAASPDLAAPPQPFIPEQERSPETQLQSSSRWRTDTLTV